KRRRRHRFLGFRTRVETPRSRAQARAGSEMSKTDTITAPPPSARADAQGRRGRWIEHWEPEDPIFWEQTGKAVARKNLIFSIIAEHMGFSIWVLWTIVVINLGNIGITLSVSELFILTA